MRFQGDFPADFGLISRGGSNSMREGGRVERDRGRFKGELREDLRGFKGDSFYTWRDCGVDMRHPAFGEAIGGGYRPPTQIGVSYRKCQLFFPIFIKNTK